MALFRYFKSSETFLETAADLKHESIYFVAYICEES
jgi:hypothetical protein